MTSVPESWICGDRAHRKFPPAGSQYTPPVFGQPLEEGGPPAAVRLGLSLVRGMRKDAALRIVDARAVQPFESVADMARRAQLDRHGMQVLPPANALEGLAGERRQSLWQANIAVPDKDLLRPTTIAEDVPSLSAPTEAEGIVADYRTMGLTLRRHPSLFSAADWRHSARPAQRCSSVHCRTKSRAGR